MNKIIDGKLIAAEMRKEIAADVQKLATRKVVPGLAVVLVGEDPASRVYVSMKEKPGSIRRSISLPRRRSRPNCSS